MSDEQTKRSPEQQKNFEAVLTYLQQNDLPNGWEEKDLKKNFSDIKKEAFIDALMDLIMEGQIYMPRPDVYKWIGEVEQQQPSTTKLDLPYYEFPECKFVKNIISRNGNWNIYEFNFTSSDSVFSKVKLIINTQYHLQYKDPSFESKIPMNGKLKGNTFKIGTDWKLTENKTSTGRITREFVHFQLPETFIINKKKQETIANYI